MSPPLAPSKLLHLRHAHLKILSLALVTVIGVSSCATGFGAAQLRTERPQQSGSTTGTVQSAGSVQPGASNTGWQHTGVRLTPYTGPMTITTDGTVIDGKDIAGQLTISANDVTIQRSRIRSGGFYAAYMRVDNGYRNLTIIDSELDGQGNPDNDSAVSSHDFKVIRSNVHGWVDGFKADSNVVIQGNWLHDFSTGNGNHNDGVQISGRGNITVAGNSIEARSKGESGGMNAAVFTNHAYGIRPDNVTVRGNWINAGGYFIRIDATNFRLENNRFGHWYSWGLLHVAPGSTWSQSGNVWDDTGTPAT